MAHDPRPEMTVSEYLDYWLDSHVRKRLRKSTIRNYEIEVERFWRPNLGDIQLSLLTVDDIQVVVDDMRDRWGPGTIRVATAHLGAALERALGNQLITMNPVRTVTVPRHPPSRYRTLSQDEARAFLTAALAPAGLGGSYWYGAMLATALQTGLRPGELRGLRWENVYFDDEASGAVAGSIYVCEQIALRQIDPEWGPPKSDSSVRDVQFTPDLARALKAHKRRVEIHALQRGTRNWTPYSLVFPNKAGGPAVENGLRKVLKEVSEDAGIDPAVTFTGLRHTFASTMVDAGVPAHVVAKLLGHADVRMTINTYYDTTPSSQEAAMKGLRRYLYGEDSSSA